MEILRRFEAKTVVSLRVDPGECIQDTLEKVVAEDGGNALVLTAIGSVSKLVVAVPRLSPGKENVEVITKELEGTFELTSLIGGVGPAYAHKQANSHLHIAVFDHDGSVVGGGLRPGTTPWLPIQIQMLLHE
ncbi:MAG: DNA-binding protein [Deltaproteobacteria bacterium]|nr:MAG: DNA-binding protein [Deltaproteobacteria bacterium]